MENLVTFLYAAIGFFGAVSLVLFVWGSGLYIARLGLEIREEGLILMDWGLSFALAVIVLIALLRHWDKILSINWTLIAAVVIIGVLITIWRSGAEKQKEA